MGTDPLTVALAADRQEWGGGVVLTAEEAFGLRDVRGSGWAAGADVLEDGELAKLVGFSLDDGEGAGWADAEAEAGAVAELFTDDLRFAVDDLDGAFGAGANALAAAVTKTLIDLDDTSAWHLLVTPYYPGSTIRDRLSGFAGVPVGSDIAVRSDRDGPAGHAVSKYK